MSNNQTDTVQIRVLHFYNHPVYYPWMTQQMFEILEQAFLKDLLTAEVPRSDFEDMISAYLNTLKN